MVGGWEKHVHLNGKDAPFRATVVVENWRARSAERVCPAQPTSSVSLFFATTRESTHSQSEDGGHGVERGDEKKADGNERGRGS